MKPDAAQQPPAASDGPDAAPTGPPRPSPDAAIARDAAMRPRVQPVPVIPSFDEPCPKLASGEITLLGKPIRLWVGARREDVAGAIYLYWHATGTTADEASSALGVILQRITDQGGVVASFGKTLGTGTSTSTGVWNTGDFAQADAIVACAVQQLNIDPRRIYTGGCSAGAFQAGAMAYARSSYLAVILSDGGGVAQPGQLDAPDHAPSVMTTHGGENGFLIDIALTSRTLGADIAAKGGLAVNCDHQGSLCASLSGDFSALREAQWRFLEDHPFGVGASSDPYAAGLPEVFPDYCRIVR